jgi:hypothetical protein
MVAKELNAELNKRGLEYTWHDPKKKKRNNDGRVCKIKERCSDVECQYLLQI